MVDENLLSLAQIPYTDNLIPVENIDFETRQRYLDIRLKILKTSSTRWVPEGSAKFDGQ
jgi:glutamate synthase (ferredoxin)